MNYWLATGLLVLSVGVVFYAMGRGASRRTRRDGHVTGNAGAVVVLGYGLPLLGVMFIAIGVGQSVG